MPSCPAQLSPQHLTPPPVTMMQVWALPKAMTLAPDGRRAEGGNDRSASQGWCRMRACYLLARFVQRENEQCVHTLVAMCAMIQCACTKVSVAAAGIQVVVVVEWSSLKLFPGGLPVGLPFCRYIIPWCPTGIILFLFGPLFLYTDLHNLWMTLGGVLSINLYGVFDCKFFSLARFVPRNIIFAILTSLITFLHDVSPF